MRDILLTLNPKTTLTARIHSDWKSLLKGGVGRGVLGGRLGPVKNSNASTTIPFLSKFFFEMTVYQLSWPNIEI